MSQLHGSWALCHALQKSLFVIAALASLPGQLSAADTPAVAKNAELAPVEVDVHRDIAYRDLHAGEDASKGKNKLDLFVPKGKKDFPVLFFVHGGGWRQGDKNFLGFYGTLAMFWARQGIGTVVTNYRLSPAVMHPAHIEDVADAFAWTHRNIANYGGRVDRLFACGHSAGGHLVSLLATDESYLKLRGLTRSALRGVIPISGVFDVAGSDLRLFSSAFGGDLELRKKASPLHQVTADGPPFLIVYADNDFPTCGEVSEKFCKALKTVKCPAETLEVKSRNHISILLMANGADDPVTQAIKRFVDTQGRASAGSKSSAVGGGQP